MKTPRVILLHKKSLNRGNVMVAEGGGSAKKRFLSTADEDTPDLKSLRQSGEVEIEAPGFDVKLINPVERELGQADAAHVVNWGIDAIAARESPYAGRGVTVAVLDTGVDASHPAFAGIDLVEQDFTGEGNGDENGHGTHCAGTICGQDFEGVRIGVARGIDRLLVGKVLGKAGGGGTDSIVDAIAWAVREGAHIISMSLGMDFPGYQNALQANGVPAEAATSMALDGYRQNLRIFDYLAKMIAAGDFLGRGALVIAATGNESRREALKPYTIAKGPPAAADGFVSVAAVQRNAADGSFSVADFSNTQADVAAPGVDIWSAKPGGGLEALSGTSMATPHVAGVAALWAEKSMQNNNGRVYLSDVIDSLRYHAINPGGLSRAEVGKGVVQAPN